MSKTKASHALNHATTLVLGLCILLLATSIFIALTNHNNPNAAFLFGMKPMYTTSDAMEPAIGQNSIVIAHQTAYSDIQVGDIVLRTLDDRMVFRRVVKTNAEGSLITLADNRPFEDATALDESTYIAKVLFK